MVLTFRTEREPTGAQAAMLATSLAAVRLGLRICRDEEAGRRFMASVAAIDEASKRIALGGALRAIGERVFPWGPLKPKEAVDYADSFLTPSEQAALVGAVLIDAANDGLVFMSMGLGTLVSRYVETFERLREWTAGLFRAASALVTETDQAEAEFNALIETNLREVRYSDAVVHGAGIILIGCTSLRRTLRAIDARGVDLEQFEEVGA